MVLLTLEIRQKRDGFVKRQDDLTEYNLMGLKIVYVIPSVLVYEPWFMSR